MLGGGVADVAQQISNTSKAGGCKFKMRPGTRRPPREDSRVFRRDEFLGSKCCEVCESNPDCLYAHTDGHDCFLASYLDVGAVGGLVTTEFASSKYVMALEG